MKKNKINGEMSFEFLQELHSTVSESLVCEFLKLIDDFYI